MRLGTLILTIGRAIFTTPLPIQKGRRDIKCFPAVMALAGNSPYLTTVLERIGNVVILNGIIPSFLVTVKARWYKVVRAIVVGITVNVVSIKSAFPLTGAAAFDPLNHLAAIVARLRFGANLSIQDNAVFWHSPVGRCQRVIGLSYHLVSTVPRFHNMIISRLKNNVNNIVGEGEYCYGERMV